MKNKTILIFSGEPNSIFFEIFFKVIKNNKIKNPLILISSIKLLNLQMKKFNFKKKVNVIKLKNLSKQTLDNNKINLLNIEYNQKNTFEKISKKSNVFIKNSFKLAFKTIKENNIYKFINGPISKKTFLDKKFLGITEYISNEFAAKNTAMLIYNKKLSVCPITTHLPLKLVAKKINKKIISDKVYLIDKFYKENFNIKPKIAILGLNPHCESTHEYNEDEKIIKPCVKFLSKVYNISGPYSSDTIFLKNNRKNFDLIIGMYHDQVLTPIKTLFEYDAINITIGLPFLRVSPDHGPNESMLGKNKSNYLSLLNSIKFLDF